MRTIILRKTASTVFESATRGNEATIEVVGAESETANFETEIVNASLEEASKDSNVIAVGNPDMPIDLIEPVAHDGGGAPSGKVSWGIEAVGANAEGLKVTGKGVAVAVLDTGIDLGHEAFKNVNFANDDLGDFTGSTAVPREAVKDEHGHGTHCAGTIFGRDVEGMRIGVAPGIERVIIGKILGERGATAGTIIEAVNWAHRRGAQVISLSVGQNYPKYYEALRAEYGNDRRALSDVIASYVANISLFNALSRLMSEKNPLRRGAVLVAAAGNESDRPAYATNLASPASGEKFLSVAALARPDGNGKYGLAKFSNRGAMVSAPGVGIWSARKGGGLVPFDGTSMATPHVAGVAALWIERLTDEANGSPPDADTVIEEIKRRSIGLSKYLSREDTGMGLVQAPRP